MSPARPVVHFEISSTEPARLRQYFGDLFGWEFDTDSPVPAAVSRQGEYGFITPGDAGGIPGGIGGGHSYPQQLLFYVGVDDVGAALTRAEELGGTRIFGPVPNPSGELVVGQFRDPDGNVVGVAGPA